MKTIKINVNLGDNEFTLKFGFGLVSYMCEKENLNFGSFFNEIQNNPLWSYKLIFHAIRYYELCADLNNVISDHKLWDLIDIESNNVEKINKIMASFSKSFPQSK